jgi:hypothetical protein
MPPPPVNEDGISFSVEPSINHDESVSTCDEIAYTFHLRNTNCLDKTIASLRDTLPNGMVWIVADSIALDNFNNSSNPDLVINYEGADNNILVISNLIIPAGQTIDLRGKVKFKDDAAEGNYETRGTIRYEQIVSGVPTNKLWNSVCAFDLHPYTNEYVTLGEQLDNLSVAVSTSRPNYVENNEITVTYVITNSNTMTITDMNLIVNYDAGFKYTASSFTNTSATPGTASADESGNEGCFTISGFSLATGTTTITFKLKAPATPVQELDDGGSPISIGGGRYQIESLDLASESYSDMDDACVQQAIYWYGEKSLPYVMRQNLIINQHISTHFPR